MWSAVHRPSRTVHGALSHPHHVLGECPRLVREDRPHTPEVDTPRTRVALAPLHSQGDRRGTGEGVRGTGKGQERDRKGTGKGQERDRKETGEGHEWVMNGS